MNELLIKIGIGVLSFIFGFYSAYILFGSKDQSSAEEEEEKKEEIIEEVKVEEVTEDPKEEIFMDENANAHELKENPEEE